MVLVNRYIKRLKSTLLYKILLKQGFIYVTILALLLMGIHRQSFLMIFILICYIGYLLKKNWKCALCAICIIIIVLINYYARKTYFQSLYQEYYTGFAVVERIKKVNEDYQIKFKLNKGYVLYYSEEPYQVGDQFYIEGKTNQLYQSHYPGGFNHYLYASYQNIYGSIQIDKMIYQKHRFSIYYLHNLIDTYFENNFKTESKGMLKALIIGNKDVFDENLNQSISKIGISHLFVISGLHVNMIALCISQFLSLFKKKLSKTNQEGITILVLFVYYSITGFLISVFRVVFGSILKFLNDKLRLELSSFNLMCLQIIFVLMVNPLYAFQYSFLLSYTISTSIIMCSVFFKKKKKLKYMIMNQFMIGVLSTIMTIPIAININPDINFLSLVYNLFYIPFVSYFILPLSFLTAIISPLEIIYEGVYFLFKNMTIFLSQIRFLSITYPLAPELLIVMYYMCIYFYFRQKESGKRKSFFFYKYVIFFFLINVIWINISYFNLKKEVYFLDLPKGEATFIKEKNNKLNILIDTGENGYDDLLLFLKKQGIRRLDVIIISHGDSDHNGMLEELIQSFLVKEVWFSAYDEQTKKIAKGVKQRIIDKMQKVTFNENIAFEFISPTHNYGSRNENSLVFLAQLFQKKYLFTGDIEKNCEMNLPFIGKVDYLKVPHHGSNTSSTQSLFDKVDFQYAICMNGYQNSFSFPAPSIERKYKDKFYVTSKKGTLVISNHKVNEFL